MPCRNDFPDRETNVVSRASYDELVLRLDAATRAACTAMTALDFWETTQNKDIIMEAANSCWINVEDQNHVNKWWQAHQAQDKARKDALIQSAKDKLTAEERKALGI